MRAEQEHGIKRVVPQRDVTRISLVDVEARWVAGSLTRELYVQRHGLDELDPMPYVREPSRIPSVTASDAGHHRFRREKPQNDPAGSVVIEYAQRGIEPAGLEAQAVIGEEIFRWPRAIAHLAEPSTSRVSG